MQFYTGHEGTQTARGLSSKQPKYNIANSILNWNMRE